MPQEAARNVRRLRPLRVLLVSRDRRFMRVTSFLLERRGYDVLQASSTDIIEAAVRSRADVVVLEPEPSRATSARAVAALAALPTPPGMVMIENGAGERTPGASAVPKWARIDDLAREIDSASLHRDTARAIETLHP
jgi:CheY-like chemotaxis protein